MGSLKEPQDKKTVKPDFNAIADRNPIVWQSVHFLCDLHSFIDNASVTEMDAFITKYISCGIEPFETYAKGIKKDHCSVENAILDRTVNNGMIEGFNNKIKLMRRVHYGRSKVELLNAFSVLSTQEKFRYSNYTPMKYRHSKAAS
jgi:transposase